MYDAFTRIDDNTRPDHHYLTADDHCAFFGEYTARKGYADSDTNQLIMNIKIGMEHRNSQRFYYKSRDIGKVAMFMNGLIGNPIDLTFVPVPPSKAKTDALYDNRLIEILTLYRKKNQDVDFREIVIQTQSMRASHECDDNRITPAELIEHYTIDENVISEMRDHIVIFDDMLTTGSHFRAMQTVLSQRFPEKRIGGMFVARRVPESGDPAALFGEIIDI